MGSLSATGGQRYLRNRRSIGKFEIYLAPRTPRYVLGKWRMTRHSPVAICFSGGGFRAALYGLGVARYLAESGLLANARVLNGVSGGSLSAAVIVAAARGGGAALADVPFEREVFEPFLATVTDRSIRDVALRRWLVGRVTPRGAPRNVLLAQTLADALVPGASRLADLPDRPQLVIAATDLATGRAFRFAKPFIGSWDLGYIETPPWFTLATALAASAAAPPFIPVLQLDTRDLAFKNAPAVVSLTDGGVYDNLGIEWFQGWASHRRPPGAEMAGDLIVVNASGPLLVESRAVRGVSALNRMRKIQYAQTQATRVRWFVADLEAGRQRGLYFGITADPRRYRLPGGEPIPPSLTVPALPSSLVIPLATLRTDFNRFRLHEARLLCYHGYWSAHARIGSLRPEQALHAPRWREFAGMSEPEAMVLARSLSRPRRRIGIGERVR